MKTLFIGFIARLLEQIRTPQSDYAMPIKFPGRKHAGRQVIRAAGNRNEYRFGVKDGNQFQVTIKKILLGKMIDPCGQSIVAGPSGIDSYRCRSAQSEIN